MMIYSLLDLWFSSSGSYSWIFTSPDTYYYRSTPVSVNNIEMRGTIEVVLPESLIEPVDVLVGNYSAEHPGMEAN